MQINRARWMSEIAATIGSRCLRQLVLPGTHDSGTSAIDSSSELSPDAPEFPLLSSLPKQLTGKIISRFRKLKGLRYANNSMRVSAISICAFRP